MCSGLVMELLAYHFLGLHYIMSASVPEMSIGTTVLDKELTLSSETMATRVSLSDMIGNYLKSVCVCA